MAGMAGREDGDMSLTELDEWRREIRSKQRAALITEIDSFEETLAEMRREHPIMCFTCDVERWIAFPIKSLKFALLRRKQKREGR